MRQNTAGESDFLAEDGNWYKDPYLSFVTQEELKWKPHNLIGQKRLDSIMKNGQTNKKCNK